MTEIFFNDIDAWFMYAYNHVKEHNCIVKKHDIVIDKLLYFGLEFDDKILLLKAGDALSQADDSAISNMMENTEIKAVEIINKQLLAFL